MIRRIRQTWLPGLLVLVVLLAFTGALVVADGAGGSDTPRARERRQSEPEEQDDMTYEQRTDGVVGRVDGEDQGRGSLEELIAESAGSDTVQSSVEEGDLAQVACSLLASYRDTGTCVLAGSGYLDLMGSVWACVIEGGDWAEVCVVSQQAEGDRCVVNRVRIDVDEIEQTLGIVDDAL